MPEDLRESALEYHRLSPPGKLAVVATKPLANQRDLALAYSPGVAAACRVIVDDPLEAAGVTARGNLIAVITNGTAVLGLGAIGPLASKPVMEGKAVLFKKFSGIDVFDIEIDETDPAKFVDIVASLEPTFGGINLEDIKAPECFEIEGALRERMKIPVFHDDQHGTAIIVAAAIVNGLRVVGKDIAEVKLVASGAGAAAIACLDLLAGMGLPVSHIWVTDIVGVVYQGPDGTDGSQEAVLCPTDRSPLARGGHRGRRYFSRPFGPWGPEAGNGQDDGGSADNLRACQSRSRDPAGGCQGRSARCHHGDGKIRLSQSGQQRPLLSLYLSRRAGCGRDGHQRGDEGRLRDGARQSRKSRTVGYRCNGVRWRGAQVRAGIPDPETLRSALDGGGCPGRGEGGHGKRRRDAADRGLSRPTASASARSCSVPDRS